MRTLFPASPALWQFCHFDCVEGVHKTHENYQRSHEMRRSSLFMQTLCSIVWINEEWWMRDKTYKTFCSSTISLRKKGWIDEVHEPPIWIFFHCIHTYTYVCLYPPATHKHSFQPKPSQTKPNQSETILNLTVAIISFSLWQTQISSDEN